MNRSLALLLGAALLVPACSTSGLQFGTDNRIEWVTEDRATLTLPATIEWDTPGFEVTGPDGSEDPDAGYFAVFVDRSPQGRGATLASLAADDDSCLEVDGCPNATWFIDHDVYVVEDGTSLTLDQLPFPTDQDAREFHDLTLVPLDGTGRRQGEAAFRLRIEIDRGTAAEGGDA